MAFSFGFSGDDIEDDSTSIFASHDQNGDSSLLSSTDDYKSKFMTATSVALDQDYVPRKHSVQDLLRQSIGVRMSYSQTKVEGHESLIVARRDLFDVKHQLMTQDDLSATDEILLGLTNEDLRVATYEGGLKSWECTFDLMQVLGARGGAREIRNVLEMGCGTGLPSALILQQMLECAKGEDSSLSRRLILADYNESVLRLVTVPNLLFTWCELQSAETLRELQGTEASGDLAVELRTGEVEVTEKLVSAFVSELQGKNIQLEFVSGGWSPQFVTLLSENVNFDLVLASETIYSPETLPIFTDTMLCLMSENTEALVAAKRVYFGVGGGVPEFERALDQRKVKYQTISEVTSQGVVRAILRVSL